MTGDRRADSPEGIAVRSATPADRLGVRRVLDAAMLAVREDLRDRIAAGDVLVAVTSDSAGGDDGSVLGALVLVAGGERPPGDAGTGGAGGGANAASVPPAHADAAPADSGRAGAANVDDDASPARIDAVAVRRARRGQGVGSALVRAAAERRGRLTATFDSDVRPFYESLGFEVSRTGGDGDRLVGRRDAREE